MKAFFSLGTLLFVASASAESPAPELPTVAGPYTELRKAPLFTAPPIPLAKTWGHAIPPGTTFQVEKIYGRWVFGKPSPLPHMKAPDFAPSGWVFSRQLLLPGDAPTLPPQVVKSTSARLYHARSAWKKLGMPASPLDFLESLTLSRKTLQAFSLPEQGSEGFLPAFSLLPEAFAADPEDPSASMGLTGSDLSFLDQEIKVVQERKKKESHVREAKKLKAPPPPAIDDKVRIGLLGRFMLERYLELPSLSMEEVDGHIYMRATAARALEGCPVKVKEYWKTRSWGYFRVFRLKSRPELKHPWFEIALPGGYFGVSGRAIELASSESELAFLLVRQLVRELRVKRHAVRFDKKNWPDSLPARAEEAWDSVLKAQSTKESENLDVADEIAVDLQALECISRAGYRPMAGVTYLKKLALNRDQPWAAWFEQHAIGLDYRIERVVDLTNEALAHQKFPEGKDLQAKRFAAAAKQWNILP